MTCELKRPLPVYIIWLGDNREQIKSENMVIKVTEFAQKKSKLCRGPSYNFIWEQKAIEAKKRYKMSMKMFEENQVSRVGR